MTIKVKIHSTPNGRLVAMCDSDLFGKLFEEGERQLNLKTSFYDGEETSDNETEVILRQAYVVNAVGPKAIDLLKRLGFIGKEKVIVIAGIPHAQCVLGPR